MKVSPGMRVLSLSVTLHNLQAREQAFRPSFSTQILPKEVPRSSKRPSLASTRPDQLSSPRQPGLPILLKQANKHSIITLPLLKWAAPQHLTFGRLAITHPLIVAMEARLVHGLSKHALKSGKHILAASRSEVGIVAKCFISECLLSSPIRLLRRRVD